MAKKNTQTKKLEHVNTKKEKEIINAINKTDNKETEKKIDDAFKDVTKIEEEIKETEKILNTPISQEETEVIKEAQDILKDKSDFDNKIIKSTDVTNEIEKEIEKVEKTIKKGTEVLKNKKKKGYFSFTNIWNGATYDY